MNPPNGPEGELPGPRGHGGFEGHKGEGHTAPMAAPGLLDAIGRVQSRTFTEEIEA